MECIMTVEELCARYGKHEALQDLNLSVPKGSITAIIGPSGCGKTTLLHCLNGMMQAAKGNSVTGQICLGGKNIAQIPGDELRRRVGLVFQNPAPFPFSIYKNMSYALKYYGMRDRAALDRAVTEKLKLVGLYEEVKGELDKSALKLSGGQQQRLCIARALTVEPELLLLDEPCSALDVKASGVIEDMLLRMKREYAMVIVTHNIAQARRIADYAAFLLEGRLVEFGEAGALFKEPRESLTREFLAGLYG